MINQIPSQGIGMPEYTLSLLIWIVPIVGFTIFFHIKNLLTIKKRLALGISISILAAIGIILDLFFARFFFTFPDPAMTIGFKIKGIPVEEFIFYITGFWFILFLYVFCDEWYMVKYNPDDTYYARYARRLHHTIFLHWGSIFMAVVFIAAGIIIKFFTNGVPPLLPGYFVFLVIVAYTPTILFYRVCRKFVNWRAFAFSLLLTVLLSIIWEVTLALPRGYWNYQHQYMLGVFIPVWASIPIEAVSVWISSTLVILFYEWLKIRFFTIK
jgi:hypothetical protein